MLYVGRSPVPPQIQLHKAGDPVPGGRRNRGPRSSRPETHATIAAMPELPEVEVVARTLGGVLPGRRVRWAEVLAPKILRTARRRLATVLPGRRVLAVRRQAKRIHILLDNAAQLVVHLGMTGRLVVVPADHPRPAHCRLAIGLSGGEELHLIDPRRFGRVWVLPDPAAAAAANLPGRAPDPFALTPDEFARLLERRRQIKALLLDQNVVAGLGNIYCDESLHRCGIHPLTPASSLSMQQRRRLWRTIRRVLRSAIRAGGSSVRDYRDGNGRAGRFQRRHRVYGRAGLPCRACGTTLIRIVAAGRGTVFCPRCQPAPARPARRRRL